MRTRARVMRVWSTLTSGGCFEICAFADGVWRLLGCGGKACVE